MGNLLWTRHMSAYIEALSVDKNGDSYITGGHAQTTYFCGGANASPTLSSSGHLDVFLAKYDTNGNLAWVKSFGDTASDDHGGAVKADLFGNVIVTGNYWYIKILFYITTILFQSLTP